MRCRSERAPNTSFYCRVIGAEYTRSMRFGPFEFDADTLDLRRNGVPVHLQHQPKRVLAILVRNADRTVTREELRRQVWGETFVDFDRGLNYCIAQIRSALGDDATRSVYVQTVAREGYRFIAPIAPYP